MLNRILGRTSIRSSTRNSPHFHYSPLGPVDYLTPGDWTEHHRWVTEAEDTPTALTLIGFALMNQRMIRIHGPSPVVNELRKEIDRLLPMPAPGSRRDKEAELGAELTGDIHTWRQELQTWDHSRMELEQIMFGALNSFEVLTSLLRSTPRSSVHLFHGVNVQSFDWTRAEYQYLDGLLGELSHSRMKRFTSFGRLESEGLNESILAASSADELLSQISAWQRDLNELYRIWSDLTGQLHRTFRQQDDLVDWSTTWQDLERSTLGSFRRHPDLQVAVDDFLDRLHFFDQSVGAHNLWFRWRGFQSISIAEIEQEIKQLVQRLEHLRDHVDDFREIAIEKSWYTQLPGSAREILKRLAGLDPHTCRSAFTAWYLSRWIEYRTPAQAWMNLSCRSRMDGLREDLQQKAHRWLRSMARKHGTERWSDWLVDSTTMGSSMRNQVSVQMVDLYLGAEYDTQGGACVLARSSMDLIAADLERLNRHMAETPRDWRQELPAPVHRIESFWSPREHLPYADRALSLAT